MAFEDNFNENDVLAALEGAGLEYKNGGRYILAQCPTHEDQHPSVQIFKSDWFVNCLAGCGRYHITKAFPELNSRGGNKSYRGQGEHIQRRDKVVVEREYKSYDLYAEWEKLPFIPRNHDFKGIPLDVLDDLGWRWAETPTAGMGTGYFIPYFDPERKTVPFAQMRHASSSSRRFTFLPDAKPVAYGRWNVIGNEKLFVVEGTSDCAVMQHCMIPWIGMPSAASGSIMKELALFCKANGITLVYAGDNDEAGDKLKAALDAVMPYRSCQPPKEFKDWGDFFEAKGKAAVMAHCIAEMFE